MNAKGAVDRVARPHGKSQVSQWIIWRPRRTGASFGLCCANLALWLAHGCVLPPAIVEEQTRIAPQVDRSRSSPNPAQIVQVRETAPEQESVRQTFFVVFSDPDSEEVTLRLFVDADYSATVDEVVVGPSSGRVRVGGFDVESLCDGLLTVGRLGIVQVFLSDTGFVDGGPDLSQPASEGGRLGGRDEILWRVECLPPLSA